MTKTNLQALLKFIDPEVLTYQEWVNVGMALKHEGYSVGTWEEWSTSDSRFRDGECEKKWESFRGSGKPVTAGTIVQLAKEGGWQPKGKEFKALDWNDTIEDEKVIIDKNWLELEEVSEPKTERWDGTRDLIKYLEVLFESNDHVGYVVKSFEKDGKFLPQKGHWDRTAGQLIEELAKSKNISEVLGDYNQKVGAWIRFNALDGKGCRNDNVSDYKYALVESDSMELEEQYAIIKKLELPVACLVHSGNKSIHAVVKIDASDYQEYRKRVDYLYEICKKNGLDIDTQNRNPSRLSRMPGVMRKDKKQFLIDSNIGKKTWAEWHEWIEGINDDLPEPETLTEVWNHMPDLASPLIDGVLRQGHKMLLAGPSKAGKSYALIQLSIAIAEGKKWLGWDCAKGRILYVNLELDRASCLHRFKDVYKALEYAPNNLSNIDIWNLRGKAVPMDKLAPKLIRRAHKKDYIAIIIDPIYKVITGDENSADQMAHFTNQFDKVCTELGSAVIYCHHHSKGSQAGKKSMDRASGSGVFARDPDCLLDLTELEMTDAIRTLEQNRAAAKFLTSTLKAKAYDYYHENVSMDDVLSKSQMRSHAESALTKKDFSIAELEMQRIIELFKFESAWRVEGTLREFPKFAPRDVFFRYPIHVVDESEVLKDLSPEEIKPSWQKAMEKRKPKEKKMEERANSLEIAFSSLELEGENQITISRLAEEMGVSDRTVLRRIEEHGGLKIVKDDEKNTFVERKNS